MTNGRGSGCAPYVWRSRGNLGILLEQHKWGPRDKEKNRLSVIQCYCPACRRTVYAEDTESPECPVCLTPVFVSSEKLRSASADKNGSSTKS